MRFSTRSVRWLRRQRRGRHPRALIGLHAHGLHAALPARLEDLRCPCHGASFDLAGRLANGRSAWRTEGAYRGDASAYPIELPDLVRPEIKVEGDRILVWTAQA